MRIDSPELILQAFQHPESLVEATPVSWDLLVRQGRRANVIGKLANEFELRGLLPLVYPAARRHLESAVAVAKQQDKAIRWEVHCIHDALVATGIPIILLKGAAYVLGNLPAAKGRVFSDVDILVPKADIERVEQALIMHGWTADYHDAYYQRYYRQWMHEIPPLMHGRRGTVIDVHHAILPETARIKVNTPALWEGLVPVSGYSNLFVLQPVDMVLHSATHLFHEGELHNGLRDLFDLDSLLRCFGNEDDFWPNMTSRARLLGLERPLFYALRYAKRILETPIPQGVIEAIGDIPSAPIRTLMDFCYLRALRPAHASCSDRWTPWARFALYVRAHWIKMPLYLLIYHLVRKTFVPDARGEAEKPQNEQPRQAAG